MIEPRFWLCDKFVERDVCCSRIRRRGSSTLQGPGNWNRDKRWTRASGTGTLKVRRIIELPIGSGCCYRQRVVEDAGSSTF